MLFMACCGAMLLIGTGTPDFLELTSRARGR
jgi:hypothetical protein